MNDCASAGKNQIRGCSLSRAIGAITPQHSQHLIIFVKKSVAIPKPELEEVYDIDKSIKGKVYMHELSGTGHKVQLIDKEGNLLTEKTIEPNEKDGVPVSDSVEFEFTDVDSSKLIAKDELKVQIVSPDFDKLEEGSTIIKESPKPIDKEVV